MLHPYSDMYPIDRRKLACHIYSLFLSLRRTAKILQVSHTTVSRWLKNTEQKKYCKSYVITKSSLIIETIHSSLKNDPFLSIRKLTKIIEDVNEIKVSRELVRTSIHKLGYSNKKAKLFSVPKNLEEKTSSFIEQREIYKLQGRSFISIDETSFGRNGKDTKGYCLRGKQLKVQRSNPNRITISSLVAISDSKIIHRQEVKGSFNSELFSKFILDIALPQGTVILLDNVSFHHSLIVREAAKSKGFELLYTPPYSPWFNPIEGVFSIVKRNFYQLGCINTAFDSVNEKHCKALTRNISETVEKWLSQKPAEEREIVEPIVVKLYSFLTYGIS